MDAAPPRVIRVDRPFRRQLVDEERRLRAEQRRTQSGGDRLSDAAIQQRLRDLRRQWRRSHSDGGTRQRAPSWGSKARDAGDDVEPAFASNVVVSAKYSLLNFGPRVLLAQLKRPSNIYFLLIALLQTIKEVSNTSGIPTILLPLGVVFVCSAIKEALEDRERHRADKIANSRPVLTLGSDGKWETKQWGEVQVGDIVKVLNNQTVPADLFMLNAEELAHDDGDEIINEAKQVQSGEESADDSPASGEAAALTDGHVAYVETKSLDGETNLKIRTSIPVVSAGCSDLPSLNHLRGVMKCEPPNSRITSFDGSFSITLDKDQVQRYGLESSSSSDKDDGASEGSNSALISTRPSSDSNSSVVVVPVTAKQMLLRSCVLRNTAAVTGLVVFTGHETKVFSSNTEPVIKTSSVEQRLNLLIVGIVLIQQLVCLLGAMLGAYWLVRQGNDHWYLNHPHQKKPRFLLHELLRLHVRYFIIMQNFVPISLNVSLEFVKYWQAYFIEQDLEMYDEPTDMPAIVRSSSLNEDLGRVHHIFTDKTGTLTMNLMLFRYCMIDGKHYGGAIVEGDIEAKEENPGGPNAPSSAKYVEFDPTELFADIRVGGRRADQIRLFLRHLALCHTLIPTKSAAEMCKTSEPEYSASSPDEQALVSAAAYCNVRFVHRTPDSIAILEPGETVPSIYRLLNVLEFDSDRKRMTVIVETPDGEILLLCKGADTVILERLADHQGRSDDFLDGVYDQLSRYAKCGMRTLCMAYKSIDRDEYERWSTRFADAQASMDELSKKRQGMSNAIDTLMNEIERDLSLLGVTAVQDKLQVGVPKTLQLLQDTNMKIWTLTGDKMETAVNIGYASALLSNDMELHEVSSVDYSATVLALQGILDRCEQLDASLGLLHSSRRGLSSGRHGGKSSPRESGSHAKAKSSWIGLLYGTDESKQNTRSHRRRQSRKYKHRYSGNRLYSAASMGSLAEGVSDEEGDADDEQRAQSTGLLDAHRAASMPAMVPLPVSKLALVIDGKALEFALRPRVRERFYKVTKRCVSVICCRVSPKQKADIVEFIRTFEPEHITLAIGDGANDVGMIQAAHIGVGISGLEGTQAVNASDYAIAQFRFLQRLLFVHGRWAYRRVTKLMSYMLYKNVTYVLTTFWFGCYCGFSGQPLILDVAAQSFNVIYTSIPLVLFAVFDQDVSSESAAKFPALYSLGQRNKLLQRKVFWPWILNGIWHSIVIFFISTWAFEGGLSIEGTPTIESESGKDNGLVTLGFVVFTNLVVVVNLKLCLETFMLTWQFLVTVAVSILLWFAVAELIALPGVGITQAVGEMTYLDRLPSYWLICVLVITMTILRDSLWKVVRRLTFPSSYHILQEREVLSMPNSPRRIRNEQRGRAWSDIQATVVDYAKMFRRMPPFESPRESYMRSSPLSENLMTSQDAPGSRNIRARWSFHATEPGSSGVWDDTTATYSVDMPEDSGLMVSHDLSQPSLTRVDSDTLRRQYHGYAFSEDEYMSSDLESLSSNSPRGLGKARRSFSSQGGVAVAAAAATATAAAAASASYGAAAAATTGGRSLKQMLKSVRGTKNA